MKELSIEEKAKAYDEAIEKSKEFYILCEKCGAKDTVDFLEEIFPELKESEDERIRKNLIGYINGISENEICKEAKNSWIAWLEKQGEQKPAEWSEEDENKVTLFMQLTEGCDNEEELADWLKSLKDRYTWKPSDEQLEALSAMREYCDLATSFDVYSQEVVESLYQDLKKLKE